MSSPPNPNDLTRHQLDELDALLQRMLSLPLSASPPAVVPAPVLPAPAVPPAWRMDLPAAKSPHLADAAPRPVATAAAVARVAPPTVEVIPSAPVPATPSLFGPPDHEYEAAPAPSMVATAAPKPATAEVAAPLSAAQFVVPAALPPRTLRGVDAPALPAGFKPLPPLPSAVHAPVNLTVAPPESDEAEPVPALLKPLFLLNAGIEWVVSLAGPIGAGVLRPMAKNAFAALGVALLVGAAAWSAQGLGYVRLPFPR